LTFCVLVDLHFTIARRSGFAKVQDLRSGLGQPPSAFLLFLAPDTNYSALSPCEFPAPTCHDLFVSASDFTRALVEYSLISVFDIFSCLAHDMRRVQLV
jgi:hypothetical protein